MSQYGYGGVWWRRYGMVGRTSFVVMLNQMFCVILVVSWVEAPGGRTLFFRFRPPHPTA